MPDPRREAIRDILRKADCHSWYTTEQAVNDILALLPPVPDRAKLADILTQAVLFKFASTTSVGWENLLDRLMAWAGQGPREPVWCDHIERYQGTLWRVATPSDEKWSHVAVDPAWTCCPICGVKRPGHDQP